MLKKYFTESDLKILHDAILSAEKNTSGEIVPMVVARSASYVGYHALLAIVGLLFTSAGALAWWYAHPWWSAFSFVAWQILGLFLGFLISELSLLQRILLPNKILDHAVHRAAFANFAALGLAHKENRNGVLIYVSLMERKIQILADSGIHDKLSDAYWAEQSQSLAAGIAQGKLLDAVKNSVESIAKPLTLHFPCGAEDKKLFKDEVQQKPAY